MENHDSLTREINLLKDTIEVQNKHLHLQSNTLTEITNKLKKEEEKGGGGNFLTPITGPIYIAIIGAIITISGSILQKYKQIKLDSLKAQQQIVMSALKKNNLLQAKTDLEFAVTTGLLPDDSSAIMQSIRNGSVDNIISPFKICAPQENDSIIQSKVLEVSGTAGFIKNPNNFIILARNADISLPNPLFYPINNGGITVSSNGKWFTSGTLGFKGPKILLIGIGSSKLLDLFNYSIAHNYQGFTVNDSSFHVLDYVRINVK